MARLRHIQTGSIVNVPDEKAERAAATGYFEPVDSGKQPAKKAAAKKAAPAAGDSK